MEVSVGDRRMRWGQAPGSGVSSGDQGPHCVLPPDTASLRPFPPGPLPPPYPLKQVKVPIVENSVCDGKYHSGLSTDDSVPIVQEDNLCAGDGGRDSCQVGQRTRSPHRLALQPH